MLPVKVFIGVSDCQVVMGRSKIGKKLAIRMPCLHVRYHGGQTALENVIFKRIESFLFMQQTGLLRLRSIVCASLMHYDGVYNKGSSFPQFHSDHTCFLRAMLLKSF